MIVKPGIQQRLVPLVRGQREDLLMFLVAGKYLIK